MKTTVFLQSIIASILPPGGGKMRDAFKKRPLTRPLGDLSSCGLIYAQISNAIRAKVLFPCSPFDFASFGAYAQGERQEGASRKYLNILHCNYYWILHFPFVLSVGSEGAEVEGWTDRGYICVHRLAPCGRGRKLALRVRGIIIHNYQQTISKYIKKNVAPKQFIFCGPRLLRSAYAGLAMTTECLHSTIRVGA